MEMCVLIAYFFYLKFGIPNYSTLCTFLILLSDVSRRFFEFSSQGASFFSYTVKPQFSNILVLKQFGSRPSCSWEKCLSCLTKLRVLILYLTTLSCWYLCDQSCLSQATKKEIWFFWTNHFSNSFPYELSSRTEVPIQLQSIPFCE